MLPGRLRKVDTHHAGMLRFAPPQTETEGIEPEYRLTIGRRPPPIALIGQIMADELRMPRTDLLQQLPVGVRANEQGQHQA